MEAVIAVLGDRAVERRSRRWRRPSTCDAAAPSTCPGWRSPATRPASWPSSPPPSARSPRCVATASRSGWRTVAASAETTDPLAMSAMLLDKRSRASSSGPATRRPPTSGARSASWPRSSRPPRGGARSSTVILAGGMADHLAAFGDVGPRPGEVVLGPAAQRGSPAGPLADLLIAIALPPDDARRALGAGRDGAGGGPRPARRRGRDRLRRRDPRVGRARASAAAPRRSTWRSCRPRALAPAEPDDAVVDRVGQWSTWGADRHRLRDRLRELRIAPWADATGEGVRLRMAAARAALGRLAECDARVGEPPRGRPRRGGRRRVGRRARSDRRPRPRRRPAPAGRRPVRARPCPDPRAARVDPRPRRAPGDGRRPRRRPAGPARHVRHAGRDAARPERGLGGRPRGGRRLDRARPHARWPGPRRPAARHVRRSPSSGSATGSGSARAAGISRST